MGRLPPAEPNAEEKAIRAREGSTPPNLSLVIAHAPNLARIQLEMTRGIVAGMTIRQKELIILEVGLLTDNAYCWGHHVPPALGGGLSVDEILALRARDHSVFPPREQALLAFCDAAVDQRVTDEIWDAMQFGRTPEELVQITMTVGFYCMLGVLQGVFQVDQDEGFGGFEQPDQ
jgi:alkylhydroperoxidase family enzyme